LGIPGANGVEQILHPLKAGCATGLQGAREVVAGEISFEIGDKAQQRLHVCRG
jgi:hypothetical protein